MEGGSSEHPPRIWIGRSDDRQGGVFVRCYRFNGPPVGQEPADVGYEQATAERNSGVRSPRQGGFGRGDYLEHRPEWRQDLRLGCRSYPERPQLYALVSPESHPGINSRVTVHGGVSLGDPGGQRPTNGISSLPLFEVPRGVPGLQPSKEGRAKAVGFGRRHGQESALTAMLKPSRSETRHDRPSSQYRNVLPPQRGAGHSCCLCRTPPPIAFARQILRHFLEHSCPKLPDRTIF